MPVNISKSRQQHISERRRSSGAMGYRSAFVFEFITHPPPEPIVAQEIIRIIGMLDKLEAYTRKRLSRIQHRVSFDSEVVWLTRLLDETKSAREQVSLCEYLIAREYLGFVRDADKDAQRRIQDVVRHLKWCEENDGRSSYTWLPVKQLNAA